jgi:transposase
VNGYEPKSYTLATPRPAPVFDAVRPIVDDILTQDQTAPPKQRHTAAQIFRRLVAEHNYAGSYDPIQRYLRQRGLDRRQTFIPLAHPPGHRAEADFGHIHADFPDGRRLVPVLVVTWSDSNCPFAVALPTERTEAVRHGLVEAFAFFGCVPRELWWDNPKTVAIHIHRGRDRTLHPRYAALASHYTFAPRACMPVTPTEKPRVGKRVQDLQRQWATPVPCVGGRTDLDARLVRQCLSARERACGDNPMSVAARSEHDRAAALAVPARRFDPCVVQPGQVDKYQTVQFDRNHYRVPRRWAFRAVTVTGYVDRVEVVGDGATVATHPRSYRRREKALDPLHFLGTLGRKPAALDRAPVYRDWQLPAAFAQLRAALAGRLGSCVGTRHYIRVLQLLAGHPAEHVGSVIAGCLSRGELDAGLIAAAARQPPAATRRRPATTGCHPNPPPSPCGPPTSPSSTARCPIPRTKGMPVSAEATPLLLKANLKRLKLPTMLAEWEELAREAAARDEAYEGYLLRLTEAEVTARSANALAARIRAAGFPVVKDFDTFDFAAIPSRPKQKVLELARGRWVEEHANCCLIGNAGTGKPHVAVALGLAICRLGRRVRFVTPAGPVTQLEGAQQHHRLDRVLTQLDRLDLLVIDELGYLSFQGYARIDLG